MNKNFLSINEAAARLGVSTKTLRRWEAQGILSPKRTVGNQRRYSLADLERADKQSLTINEAAQRLGLSAKTLRRWEEKGIISPQRTSGNQRRYAVSDIEVLKNQHPKTISLRHPEDNQKRHAEFISASHTTKTKILKRVQDDRSVQDDNNSTEKERFFDIASVKTTQPQKPTKIGPVVSDINPVVSSSSVILERSVNEAIESYSGDLIVRSRSLQDDKYSTTSHNNKFNHFLSKKPLHYGFAFSSLLAVLLVITLVGKTDPSILLSYLPFAEKLGVSSQKSEVTNQVLQSATTRREYALKISVPVEMLSTASVSGNLTAPNILYSVLPGDNITISGDPQNPTISAVVEDLETLGLVAGDGIAIDGVTITNTAPGTDQDIFANIKVGSTTISAGSNTDTFELAAGDNISLTTDTGSKKITIAADIPTPDVGIDGIEILEGDTTIITTGTSLDFLGGDFDVGESPSGEANIQLAATLTSVTGVAGNFDVGTDLTVGGNINISGGSGTLTLGSDTINDITGPGLIVSGSTLQVNLTSAGGAGSTSSNSGLEVGANGLTLLKGCTDEDILKWDDTNALWECMPDVGGGGSVGGTGAANQVAFWTNGSTLSSNADFYWDNANELLGLGTNGAPVAKLDVNGAATGKALVIFNETGDQDILTASASGVTQLSVDRSGNLTIEGSLSDLSGSTLAINDALSVSGALSLTGAISDSDSALLLDDETNIGSLANGINITTVGVISDNDGNVNINDSTDIAGNIDASGTLTSGNSNAFVVDANGNISSTGTTGITLSGNGAGLTFSGINNHLISASSGVLQLGAATLTGAIAGGGQNVTSLGQLTVDNLELNGNTLSSTASDLILDSFSGTIQLADLTTNGVVYTTGGNGTLATEAQLALSRGGTGLNITGTSITDGQLLIGNNSTDGFSLAALTAGTGISISNGSGTITISQNGSGASKFTQSDALGILYPNISTLDLLIGGVSSETAKFAFINNAGGTPIASIAGNITLDSQGVIQTTENQTFTLGGDSTGNIILSPQNGSGDVRINGTTTLNGLTYTWPGSQGSNYVLQTDGNGTLTWIDAGTLPTANYWVQGNGILYPKIADVFDFLLGGESTTSAEFAITGINDGTPVATLSAIANNTGLSLTASTGTLQSLNYGTLTLGGDTTGNISIAPKNGTGTLALSVGALTINGTPGETSVSPTCVSVTNGIVTGLGGCGAGSGGSVWTFNTTDGTLYPINNTMDLLFGGEATNSAKFAFLNIAGGTPTASIAAESGDGALVLTPTSLTTRTAQTLTIGGGDTGDINLALAAGKNLLINGTAGVDILAATCVTAINGIVTGTGSCDSPASSFIWNTSADGGAIIEGNITRDLLIGGESTESAKFAILNIADGTPTASLSAGLAGGAYLTADGQLQTTNYQQLTIGGTGTGNIVLDSGNNVIRLADLTTNGVVYTSGSNGTLNTEALLDVSRGGTGVNAASVTNGQILIGNDTGNGFDLANLTEGTGITITNGEGTITISQNAAGLSKWIQNETDGTLYPSLSTLDLLIGGTSTSSAKFAVLNVAGTTPSASVSGQAGSMYLTANGELATTNKQSLTLGTASTGNILIGTDATARNITIGSASTTGLSLTDDNWSVTAAGLATFTQMNVDNLRLDGNTLSSPSSGDLILDSFSGTIQLADLTTDGVVFTSGGNGTLNTEALLSVSRGGTGINGTTATDGQLLIGNDAGNGFTLANLSEGNGITITNGAGTITIGQSTGGASKWTQSDANGVLYPNNNSLDLLVGGTSSSSARFHVFGSANTSNTPVASVSGNTNQTAFIIDNSGTGDLFSANSSGLNRFVIKQNGNIGIGTDNPLQTVTFRGPGDAIAFDVNTQDDASIYLSETSTDPTSSGFQFKHDAVNNRLDIIAHANTDSTPLSINRDTGNIGVFTTSPLGTFNVQPSTINGGTLAIASVSGRTSFASLAIDNSLGDLFTASSSGQNRFVIKQNGNVGVGSVTPVNKFQVTPFAAGNPYIAINNSGANVYQEFQRWSGVASDYIGSRLLQDDNGFYIQVATNEEIGSQTFTNALFINKSTQAITLSTNTYNNCSALETVSGVLTCGSDDGGSGATSNWTLNTSTGVLRPNNSTVDLLIGGTSSSSARFHVFGNANANNTPVASISGNSSQAAFIVDNRVGDLFTASSSGLARFVIKQNGNVGIGTATNPTSVFQIGFDNQPTLFGVENINGGDALWEGGLSNDLIIRSLANNDSEGIFFQNEVVAGGGSPYDTMAILRTGAVGIGTTTPLAGLDIRGNLANNSLAGTQPTASVSGRTSFASLIVDNSGSGDLFTASSSGKKRFTIQQNGNVYIGDNNPGNNHLFELVGPSGGTGLGTYYQKDAFAIRGIFQHMGNTSGINSAGGLQIASQGTNNSTLGSGAIRFFTTGANSAGENTDATYTERMTIDYNGDVGIGDSSPDGSLLLDVEGAIGAATLCDEDGNNCAAVTSLTAGTNPWTVDGSDIYYDSGNVGIGTTAPLTKLHIVNGSDAVLATNTSGYLVLGSTTSTNIVMDNNEIMARNNGATSDLFLQAEGGDLFLSSAANTGSFGINSNENNILATFDLRGNLLDGGTIPVASISGRTSSASMIVDNRGAGDLFTASSSGLTRFVIQNNGNVGIGTANPQYKLELASSVATSQYMKFNPVTNEDWRIGADGFGLSFINDTDGATRMTLDEDGNVGIGSTDPTIGSFARGLEIESSGAGAAIALDATDGKKFIIGSLDSPAGLYFQDNTAGVYRMVIDTNGSIGIGTGTSSVLSTLDIRPNTTNGGTLAVASVSGRTSFATLAVDNSLGDLFTASSSGLSRFVIKQNGNVGIGTANPTGILQVNNGSVGDAQHIGLLIDNDDITDPFNLGMDTVDAGRKFIVSAQGGSLRQALAFGDVSSSTGTVFGISTSADSGSNWNPRFVIQQRGFVGIGTNNPLGTLHISGVSDTLAVASISGTSNSFAAMVVDNSGSGDLFTASSSGLNRFVIKQNGNVGIGSNNPDHTLEVLGSFRDPTDTSAMVSITSTDAEAIDKGGTLAFGGQAPLRRFFAEIGGFKENSTPSDISGYFALYTRRNGADLAERMRVTSVGSFGFNTSSPLATLDVRGNPINGGTIPIASLSAHTSFAGLVVDNQLGDLFTASSSGLTRFVIKNNGNVGIGTALPTEALTIFGDGKNILMQSSTLNPTSAYGIIFEEDDDGHSMSLVYNGSSTGNDNRISIRSESGDSNLFSVLRGGRVGISTTSPLATLDVLGVSGTIPIASFSANTSIAGLIVDNRGSGDLFTASSSGLNRFVIKQDGGVGIGTTTPTGLLDVNDPGNIRLRLSTDESTDDYSMGLGTSTRRFVLASEQGTLRQALVLSDVNSTSETFFGISSSTNGGSTWHPRFTITQNGTVNIGTPSAASKLNVTGTNALAESVNETTLISRFSDNFVNPLNNNLRMFDIKTIRKETASGSFPWSYSGNRLLSSVDDNSNANTWIDMYSGNSTTDNIIAFGEGSTTEWMRIDNGSVGIGDTSIDGSLLLDVEGAIGAATLCDQNGANCAAVTSLTAGTNPWVQSGSSIYYDSGNVGIGATGPDNLLAIAGNDDKDTGPILKLHGDAINQNESGRIRFAEGDGNYQGAYIWYNGSANVLNLGVHAAGDTDTANDTSVLSISRGTARVGIFTTAPSSTFDIRGNPFSGGTTPIASLSAQTSFAGLVVDNQLGDLFTASSSGMPRFVIRQNGNVSIGNGAEFTSSLYGLTIQTPDSGLRVRTNLADGTLASFGGEGDFGIDAPNVANGRFVVKDNGLVGINSPTPLGSLDIRGNFANNPLAGTQPTASVAGQTSFAAFVVDNRGAGDLFTASSSGLTRFVIKQDGNVGIGTANPSFKLHVADSAPAISNYNKVASFYSTGLIAGDTSQLAFGVENANRNQAELNFYYAGDHSTANQLRLGIHTVPNIMALQADGKVGVGTTNPLATLDVRVANLHQPIASFSGQTSYAGMIVDNRGAGDLFTASSSGLTRFVIKQNGNVGIGTSNTKPFSLISAGILTIQGVGNSNGLLVRTSPNSSFAGAATFHQSHSAPTWPAVTIQTVSTNTTQSIFDIVTGVSDTTGDGSITGIGTRRFAVLQNGRVGIGTNFSNINSTLDIRGVSDTISVASVSGKSNSFAAMVVDNRGTGDIFTASSSGLTRFTINNNGNVAIGTTASTGDQALTISSQGNASLFLNGDTDNVGGEIGTAFIEFSQDNSVSHRYIGTIQATDQDPEGGTFTGAISNALLIGNTGSDVLQFGTDANVRMTIATDGNVSIGTTSTTGYIFQAHQSDATGQIARFYNTSDSNDADLLALQIGYTGTLGAANNFIGFYNGGGSLIDQIEGDEAGGARFTGEAAGITSDRRLKENIETYDGDALAFLKQLNPVTFNYKAGTNPGLTRVGFIAQDVLKIFPQAINFGDDLSGYAEEDLPMLHLNYSELTPLLVRGVQDQQGQIEELKQQVDNMIAGSLDTDDLTINNLTTQNFSLAGENINTKLAGLDQSASTSASLGTQLTQLQTSVLSLSDRMASAEARIDFLETLSGFSASSSAELSLDSLEVNGNILTDSLNVLDYTTMNELSVTGSIRTGVLTINGQANGGASISTLNGDLRLQDQGFGGLDILDGLVTIDTDGNIQTLGEITAKKINIDTTNTLSASAGTGTVLSGTKSTIIYTSAVTANSLIQITFTNNYTPATRYWIKSKTAGSSFTLELDVPVTNNAKFSWFIIN